MADEIKEEIKKDDNPLDDIVDIKENGEDVGKDLLIVATVRHLVRPFLVVFFSMMYGVIGLFGLYFAYKGKIDLKDMFMLIFGSVGNTLGMVIGYNMGKPSNVDKK